MSQGRNITSGHIITEDVVVVLGTILGIFAVPFRFHKRRLGQELNGRVVGQIALSSISYSNPDPKGTTAILINTVGSDGF